jgi:hypothetical protein
MTKPFSLVIASEAKQSMAEPPWQMATARIAEQDALAALS